MESIVDLYLAAEPLAIPTYGPDTAAPVRLDTERRAQRPAGPLLPVRTGESICEALIESGSLALAAFDEGRISFASPAFLRLLGLASAQGETVTSWCRRVHSADRERVSALLGDAINAGQAIGTDCLITEPAGGAIRVHLAGYPAGPAGTAYTLLLHLDVKSRAEAPAPKLPAPVRRAFARTKGDVLDRAGELLVDAWLKSASLAVLTIGLTPPADGWTAEVRFAAEEALLKRMRPCLRDGDAIGRSGDGGLLVAIPDINSPASAGIVAGRLLAAARSSDGALAGVACPPLNIGIALFPDDDQELSGLLAHASAALEFARQSGPDSYSLAETSLNLTLNPKSICWDSTMSVGLAEVDALHGHLLEALGMLAHDIGACTDPGVLQGGLDAIRRALEADFRHEDALMADQPALVGEAHRKEHARALYNLDLLACADARQGVALAIQFLHEWLIQHIREFDSPLVESTYRPLW